MAQERTSMRKIKEVLRLHFETCISQAKISNVVKISRYTVQQYIMRFTAAGLSWPLDLLDDELERKLFSVNKGKNNRPEPDYLYLSQEIRKPHATLAVLWEEYKEQHPHGYQYSYFCDLFNASCKKKGFSKVKFNKWQIKDISKSDEITFRKWRLSNNKNKWQRAVALLDLHKGCNITKISNKIERSCRTIKKWRAAYIDNGIMHLDLESDKSNSRANNRQYQPQKRTNNKTYS